LTAGRNTIEGVRHEEEGERLFRHVQIGHQLIQPAGKGFIDVVGIWELMADVSVQENERWLVWLPPPHRPTELLHHLLSWQKAAPGDGLCFGATALPMTGLLALGDTGAVQVVGGSRCSAIGVPPQSQ
jgi:hypothetical protein